MSQSPVYRLYSLTFIIWGNRIIQVYGLLRVYLTFIYFPKYTTTIKKLHSFEEVHLTQYGTYQPMSPYNQGISQNYQQRENFAYQS